MLYFSVSPSDNLKISDFGLATVFRHQGKERKLGKCCGTPPYVAPEILQKEEYRAQPADVWSCGIILVAMLAGGLYFGFCFSPLCALFLQSGVCGFACNLVLSFRNYFPESHVPLQIIRRIKGGLKFDKSSFAVPYNGLMDTISAKGSILHN